MAQGVSIKIEKDKTDDIIKALKIQLRSGLEAVGLQAEKYAKKNCPVKTGRLQGSISHAMAIDGETVYIGTDVKYAEFVEKGTSRQMAKPYLKPAMEDHVDKYKQILEASLK